MVSMRAPVPIAHKTYSLHPVMCIACLGWHSNIWRIPVHKRCGGFGQDILPWLTYLLTPGRLRLFFLKKCSLFLKALLAITIILKVVERKFIPVKKMGMCRKKAC